MFSFASRFNQPLDEWNVASAQDTTAMFNDANRKNAISWSLTDLGLQADFNLLGAPKFSPQKGSRILADGVVLPTGFDSASFRGAFDGSNDWTQKWTNFNPQTTEY